MTKRTTQVMTLRVAPDLAQDVAVLAAAEGLSVNSWVERLLQLAASTEDAKRLIGEATRYRRGHQP